ncbi:MAG: alpha/beta hydrolase [Bdellovibrionales bacterium]
MKQTKETAFSSRGWKTAIVSALSGVGAVYLSLAMILLFFQERLIFRPTILEPDSKYGFNEPFEERWIELDGQRVDSLLFRAPAPKGSVLFFHGNAGSLDDWGMVASEIAKRTSWNVWIIDYPGYGRSQGQIRSEDQLHRLGSELLRVARQELGPDENIVVYGRSIGSGIAVKLAAENQVAGLILESPYLSLEKLAAELFPWVPTFLIRYKFPSNLWIWNVKSPVLIVHGERDEVIPFKHGKMLADESASSQLRFVPIANGHHNDLSRFDTYWHSLKTFLDEIGLSKRTDGIK